MIEVRAERETMTHLLAPRDGLGVLLAARELNKKEVGRVQAANKNLFYKGKTC